MGWAVPIAGARQGAVPPAPCRGPSASADRFAGVRKVAAVGRPSPPRPRARRGTAGAAGRAPTGPVGPAELALPPLSGRGASTVERFAGVRARPVDAAAGGCTASPWARARAGTSGAARGVPGRPAGPAEPASLPACGSTTAYGGVHGECRSHERAGRKPIGWPGPADRARVA